MQENNLMKIPPDIKALMDHFQFEQLPVEGAFYKSTYRSVREFGDGSPMGTGIIAMYCDEPLSVSCFHRLSHDEIWHFLSRGLCLHKPLISNFERYFNIYTTINYGK